MHPLERSCQRLPGGAWLTPLAPPGVAAHRVPIRLVLVNTHPVQSCPHIHPQQLTGLQSWTFLDGPESKTRVIPDHLTQGQRSSYRN